MAIVFVGIDLAKNVFAVHDVNEAGKAELVRPVVAREKLHELIRAAALCDRYGGLLGCPPLGAAVCCLRLIAPKFVTPYRMSGRRSKNDAADAAAI